MRFSGIRLVKQTEQKFRRFESVLKKKTNNCNSRALLLLKAPTKNVVKIVFNDGIAFEVAFLNVK